MFKREKIRRKRRSFVLATFPSFSLPFIFFISCVCVLRGCVLACACVCRSQRLTSSIFFYCFQAQKNVCAYSCMCVCLCMHICMCRGQKTTSGASLCRPPLSKQDLLLTAAGIELSWLALRLVEVFLFVFPSHRSAAGIRLRALLCQALRGSGVQIQVLIFVQHVLYSLNHVPSPKHCQGSLKPMASCSPCGTGE